jgi:hypothetical protein
MVEITRHRVKGTLRGWGGSNGLMQTKYVVELDGDKVWRRVYERWDYSNGNVSSLYDGQPVPVVKVKGKVFDLTSDQIILIGWDGRTARDL